MYVEWPNNGQDDFDETQDSESEGDLEESMNGTDKDDSTKALFTDEENQ